jgi:hypothetical protein
MINFIKRLLYKKKTKPSKIFTFSTSSEEWTMFSTSKKEIDEFLIQRGEITINEDNIKFENYIFEPSIVSQKNTIVANEIVDIAINSRPITIRIKDELIFIGCDKINEIEIFANNNGIKFVNRNWLINWVLEPFLDTEYTDETHLKLNELFSNYELSAEYVNELRAEVEIQMLKYNFDTTIWEWCSLGIEDVLRAMRTKYSKEEFNEFYWRIMKIALLEEKFVNLS